MDQRTKQMVRLKAGGNHRNFRGNSRWKDVRGSLSLEERRGEERGGVDGRKDAEEGGCSTDARATCFNAILLRDPPRTAFFCITQLFRE